MKEIMKLYLNTACLFMTLIMLSLSKNKTEQNYWVKMKQVKRLQRQPRSPGCDRFLAIFYKVVWSKIGNFVVRCLNYAYINASNIKSGIITCIPKDKKP